MSPKCAFSSRSAGRAPPGLEHSQAEAQNSADAVSRSGGAKAARARAKACDCAAGGGPGRGPGGPLPVSVAPSGPGPPGCEGPMQRAHRLRACKVQEKGTLLFSSDRADAQHDRCRLLVRGIFWSTADFSSVFQVMAVGEQILALGTTLQRMQAVIEGSWFGSV